MAEADVVIYNYENQLKNRLDDLEKADFLNETEKKNIQEYADLLQASNISMGRVVKTIHTLLLLSKTFDMKLDKIDQKNVQAVVGKINQSDYAEWSKHDLRAITKRFVKHSLGKKYIPYEWDWLKVKMRREKMKMPGEGEILSVEEVEKLVSICSDTRDRALISSLYESACRPSEILTLRIRDVKFDKYGCILNLRQSKTIQRPVRLVNSSAYLQAWVNAHPDKKNLDASMWMVNSYKGTRGRPSKKHKTWNNYRGVKPNSLRTTLKILGNKAGIKKRIYPYVFRHSRITHLLMNPKYPQSVVKRMVGWVDDTAQMETYLHMNNDTVDKLVLEASGLIKEEDSEDLEMTKPFLCPRCDAQNPHDAKVCQRCWFALDSTFQTEIDKQITVIATALKNPQMAKLLPMNIAQIQKEKRKEQIRYLMKKKKA